MSFKKALAYVIGTTRRYTLRRNANQQHKMLVLMQAFNFRETHNLWYIRNHFVAPVFKRLFICNGVLCVKLFYLWLIWQPSASSRFSFFLFCCVGITSCLNVKFVDYQYVCWLIVDLNVEFFVYLSSSWTLAMRYLFVQPAAITFFCECKFHFVLIMVMKLIWYIYCIRVK